MPEGLPRGDIAEPAVPARAAVAVALLSAACFLPGLRWGLPSAQRAERVLPAARRTPELLERMARARAAIYQRTGGNPSVELGEKEIQGRPLYEKHWQVPEDLLLLSYSSFLVRSGDADEQRSLAALAQIKPQRLQFNPHYFVYGGVYLYSLGAWLAAAHAARLLRLTPDITFYYKDPEQMRRLFTAGRLLSAVCAGILLMVLYRIALETGGRDAAWQAVLLAALVPALLAQARLMKPHAPAAVFVLLSLRQAARLLEPALGEAEQRAAYRWSALWGGLAMGANLAYYLMPASGIATAHLLRAWDEGGARAALRSLRDPRPWAAGLGIAAIYFATNAYIFGSWNEYRGEVLGYALTSQYRWAFDPRQVLAFWTHPVRAGLGTPLWAAFLLSLGVFTAFRRVRDGFYLLQILIVSVYFGFQTGAWADRPEVARYVLPLLLLACVMLARAAQLLAERLAPKAARTAAAGVVIALALAAAAPAWCALLNYTGDSPEGSNGAQAARWIHARVPRGAGIGIQQPMPHLYNDPPFRFGDYELYTLGNADGRPLPEYAVLGLNYATLQKADAGPPIGSLEKLGYRAVAEFRTRCPLTGWECRNRLTTADMPFVVFRRAEGHGR